MRIHSLFIVIALLPLACKKETRQIKEIESAPIAGNALCFGNTWHFDHFYQGYKGSYGSFTVHSMPIVYDNKVYLFDPSLNQIRIYDGTSWYSISSQIPFDDAVGFGFTLGNKGYLATGFGDEFWQYNFATNGWTKKADFPGSAIDPSTVCLFTIGTRGYVAGGAAPWGEYFNTLWEYDQASNAWTKKASMFFNIGYAAGFSIGNKGYIVNGAADWPIINSLVYTDQVMEYNQATNTWSVKADFPGGPRKGCQAFVIGGEAYVGGGDHGGWTHRFTDYYKYNPQTDSWKQVSDIPVKSDTFFSFSINGKGYVVFYPDLNEQPSGKQFMYKYTPKTCVTPIDTTIIVNGGPAEIQ